MIHEIVNMGSVFQQVRINSEDKCYCGSLSGMNRTISLFSVGSHHSLEMTGAAGKPGTVQDILNLNGQHIEDGSDSKQFSKHIAVVLDKDQVTFL